jgi:hypothetical protein
MTNNGAVGVCKVEGEERTKFNCIPSACLQSEIEGRGMIIVCNVMRLVRCTLKGSGWIDGRGSALWTVGRRGTRLSIRKKAPSEKRRIRGVHHE